MTIMDVRNRYVSVMKGWIGAKEGDATHREIIDIYNSITPLPRGYKLQYTDAWCAATASAAAKVAGLASIIPAECSCSRLIEKYQQMGRWVENDDYIPSPGDQIFYDWQDNGIGDNRGAPDHVGVVESVYNNSIIVIEGNYSDQVKRRSIPVNGKFIRGFGCPDFASLAEKSKGTKLMELVASDGVITSPELWASAVDGTFKVSPGHIEVLITKYHAALEAAKKSSSTK